MCRCEINCLCSLKKINQINNNMKSETEFALTLNDLLTCENLDIVKTKLEDLLKKIKKENDEIIKISGAPSIGSSGGDPEPVDVYKFKK